MIRTLFRNEYEVSTGELKFRANDTIQQTGVSWSWAHPSVSQSRTYLLLSDVICVDRYLFGLISRRREATTDGFPLFMVHTQYAYSTLPLFVCVCVVGSRYSRLSHHTAPIANNNNNNSSDYHDMQW